LALRLNSSIATFSTDVLPLSETQMRDSAAALSERWTAIRSDLDQFTATINSADLLELSTLELDSIERVINQVHALPPSARSLVRDHQLAFQTLNDSVKSARASLAGQDFESLRSGLNQLKSDVSHQYESFFRVSRIHKSWKMMVVDECRRYLDKVLKFIDIWNEIGSVALPDEADAVAQLLRETARTPDVAEREFTPRKRGKIPVPRRPRSVVEFRPPLDRPTEKFNDRSVTPRPLSRPAAKSPPARTARPQVPRICPISLVNSNSSDGIETPADDMRILSELCEFEGRFSTYIAAVGTNDVIMRMINELRVTLRTIQQGGTANHHFERLKEQLTQISQKITNGVPLFHGEKFPILAIALKNLCKLLEKRTNPTRLEIALNALSQHLDSAPGLRGRVNNRLLVEVAGNAAARRKVISEMQVVSARLVTVQQERSRADPQDIDDIDAEIDTLVKQQGHLVEKFGSTD
jgi:hypothetical protein